MLPRAAASGVLALLLAAPFAPPTTTWPPAARVRRRSTSRTATTRASSVERSGAPGSPIRFVAEGPDVRITEDNPETPDGINLEGASYVELDGFVVDGRTRTGIRAVLGSHVAVRNCRLGYNGRWGILTGLRRRLHRGEQRAPPLADRARDLR
jgi:hypothetical protein